MQRKLYYDIVNVLIVVTLFMLAYISYSNDYASAIRNGSRWEEGWQESKHDYVWNSALLRRSDQIRSDDKEEWNKKSSWQVI